ncbi:hypothetical protein AB1L42_09655 [Thalassoglobus sp. JC818]|uniref:hypothetical protein n=1 Tax=Thalassoglobus sp. JC818 TaxID=3232136 RepID=UPI00345A056C
MLTCPPFKTLCVSAILFCSIFKLIPTCLSAADSRRPADVGGGRRPALHVRQVKLYDNQGFGKPVVCRSFLLPGNWQVSGGVQWAQTYQEYQPFYYESFSAVSDNQEASIELLPAYSWLWFADPYMRQMMQQTGAPLAAPLDATGVVQNVIIPNYRPGAVVTGVTPRNDLAQAFRKELVKYGLDQIEAMGSKLYLDFVEARISYIMNGVEFQEVVVVQLTRTDFASTGMQSYTASNMFLMRAPKAKWSDYESIFATALSSMRQNPAWLKAINKFHQNIARIRQKGAQQRQQIMRQTYEDIARSNQESWEYRQDSIDRSAREFSEMIREVETYYDPSTGYEVELPYEYDYAFSNGLGDYVVTDDPFYDPNSDLFSSNWQQLQTAP